MKLLTTTLAVMVIVMVMVVIAPTAQAQLTLAPECDPAVTQETWRPPGLPPCDIEAFIEWIQKIIRFLLIISIPIGVLFIVYGAFVIITAAGSQERFGLGKKIITASVIGVAIAFGAWLIITIINRILGVK